MKRPEPSGAPSPREKVCPRRWGWLVSIMVGIHLLAVVSEPLRFFSQSDFQAGPEFVALRRWIGPYVDGMYLDHGYFFFAPNPGPSHLVAVDADALKGASRSSSRGASGRLGEEGAGGIIDVTKYAYVFPDRTRQWPRLLYHRYFMLSEFYNNSFAPDRLLPEDLSDVALVERWERDRARYEHLGDSIRRSLARMLVADHVELHRLERMLPSPEQFAKEGWRLDDPRGLIRLEEGPPQGQGAPP